MTRRIAFRVAAAALLALVALLVIPVAIGYLESPRFPVAGPGPWEALKQVGRDWSLGR